MHGKLAAFYEAEAETPNRMALGIRRVGTKVGFGLAKTIPGVSRTK